jgi:hypothetical protein
MKNTWSERLNVTKTPNQNLAFRCANPNRETQNMKKKNKSTYLPPKVTTPKYYLKWRWSALNPRENSKEYIWEWPMKLKMTYINTWMNSKRKQIKRLKLKAQSWLRGLCLLLAGDFTKHGSPEGAPLHGGSSILWVPQSSQETDLEMGFMVCDWSWCSLCLCSLSQLKLQKSAPNMVKQRSCLSPVLTIWQVITVGPRSASTQQRG